MKIYMNGNYFSKEEAAVSVFDHGLLYGDGIFEGIRIYNGKVFKLAEHLKRLYDSAKAILLDIPMPPAEMSKAVLNTVTANNRQNGYIRLVITRGPGTLGLDPDKCSGPNIIIIVDGISLYPQEFYDNGIPIVTSATRRLPPDGIDPRVKSLNYLNNILAKIEAKQAGCIEAVMLNKNGFVAECTADNIFIIDNGVILTPPLHDGALGGITRDTIFELAEAADMSCVENTLTRFDLYTAEECFLTGSGAEIVPVISIDGRSIGEGKPGDLTRKLTAEFIKLTAPS